jgi:hypothetical protein
MIREAFLRVDSIKSDGSESEEVMHADSHAVITALGAVPAARIRRPFASNADVFGELVFETQAAVQTRIRPCPGKSEAGVRHQVIHRHANFGVDARVLVGGRAIVKIGESFRTDHEVLDVEIVAGSQAQERRAMRSDVEVAGRIRPVFAELDACVRSCELTGVYARDAGQGEDQRSN